MSIQHKNRNIKKKQNKTNKNKGSIECGELALKYGWSINLSGGYHHASAESGGGFCVYADISLIIASLKKSHNINNFMVVDLDAHQGILYYLYLYFSLIACFACVVC